MNLPKPIVAASPEQLKRPKFDDEMENKIEGIVQRYPTPKAALLPVLWLCQERWGWISPGVMELVAAKLGLSPAFVEGVVSFYTMFRTSPPGRYLLQVCTTLSCQLCGAGELLEHLKDKLGIGLGETTPDGRFTLVGVQCLGACGEGPVIQINDQYVTNLTPEKLDQLLDRLE